MVRSRSGPSGKTATRALRQPAESRETEGSRSSRGSVGANSPALVQLDARTHAGRGNAGRIAASLLCEAALFVDRQEDELLYLALKAGAEALDDLERAGEVTP